MLVLEEEVEGRGSREGWVVVMGGRGGGGGGCQSVQCATQICLAEIDAFLFCHPPASKTVSTHKKKRKREKEKAADANRDGGAAAAAAASNRLTNKRREKSSMCTSVLEEYLRGFC